MISRSINYQCRSIIIFEESVHHLHQKIQMQFYNQKLGLMIIVSMSIFNIICFYGYLIYVMLMLLLCCV